MTVTKANKNIHDSGNNLLVNGYFKKWLLTEKVYYFKKMRKK